MNGPESIASDDQKSHSAAAAAAATVADDLSAGKSIGAIIQKFYLLFVCHSFEALEHIAIVALVYIVVCLFVYRAIFQSWISRRFRAWTNVRFPQCKRVLIVTAHPDDESMFFGPTILSLAKRPNCQLYLLCLSNGSLQTFPCIVHGSNHLSNHVTFIAGNYGNNGRTRQIELWNACRVLNIPAENITLVNASQLQDDPSANWKSPIIAKQILKQVHSLDIDVIITFDREGVSHHPNHCAIFYSSVSVYLASLLPDGSYFALAPFPTHRRKKN